MKALRTLTAAFALTLGAGVPVAAGILPSPPPIQRPDAVGDQVIYYYDARAGFTTFLTVRNTGLTELAVHFLFYSGGFSVPFEREVTLASGQLRILNIGELRDLGLGSQPGVALAFAVNGSGAALVSRALTGNFTVANLATGSAWGAPAAARSALEFPMPVEPASGEGPSGVPYVEPPLGTIINGTTVFLQPIQPQRLDLAAYYDPNDLEPVAESGNQLIFLSFADVSGATYSATPASTSWGVHAVRNDGTLIADTTYGLSGVNVSDLASVAGSGVNGASGSIEFSALSSPPAVTRLIFFAEALGTFGTGYLLPTLPELMIPVSPSRVR